MITLKNLTIALKIAIPLTGEATRNMIGEKIADKTTKISKTSQDNNSVRFTNEHDQETPNERYISPKGRQKLLMIWD